MTVRYTRNIPGERQVTHARYGPVGRDIARRTGRVNDAARRGAPVGQSRPADQWFGGYTAGKLKASIKGDVHETPTGPVGTVGSDLSYAASVVKGAQTHPISPRRKRMLRWRSPPGYLDDVFAHRVQHPGYRGNDFLGRALLAAQG